MASKALLSGRVFVLAVLLSAVSAQIFTEDGTTLPVPPTGDVDTWLDEAPDFVTGSVGAPSDKSTILKPLEASAVGSDASSPLSAAATEPVDAVRNLTNVSRQSIMGAVGLDGRRFYANATQDGEAAAICGDNTLKPSDSQATCVFYGTYPNDETIVCSGWIVGNRYIATTGHCLYNRALGGYIKSAEVFCNGNNGCQGPRTTTAVSFAVPSNWLNHEIGNTNPWDGGILKTKDVLAPSPLIWKERIGDYRTNVEVSGYPDQEKNIANSPCQLYPEYTGCAQFTSTGTMSGLLRSGFFTPDYDTCLGFSGGPVYDKDEKLVTAINSGYSYQPCRNVAVVLRQNGVDSGCNGGGAGVGINCLIALADSRGD